MEELDRARGTYILDVCLSAEDASAAYDRWAERAQLVADAEVRVVRSELSEGTTLFYVTTESRELVPEALLRWHEELAAGMDAERAAWRLLRSTGYGYAWPQEPSALVAVDRTSPTHFSKGALTEEAWEQFLQAVGVRES
ncbi:MAG: hypothetical protein ACK47B_01460 [Armatimonadota bacterium]